MALNADAINTEIADLAGKLDVSWADFAIYAKGKLIESAIAGGITSYTVAGRSVTKDAAFWERCIKFAMEMQGIDATGGIDEQPIRFLAR